MQKEKLFGKTLEDLKEVAALAGLPSFTAKQIADWLYKKNISSIDEMTNLPKKGREFLKMRYEFGLIEPVQCQTSIDGTKKYVFPTLDGQFIETAYIPEKDRATVCVSSQAGCKMGCLFCMTAKQGFQGNLEAGEIVNQIRSLPEWEKVTNIVYMGMGEPFDNIENVLKSLSILTSDWGFAMGPKRITVSSIGIVPGMRKFLDQSNCHLAISLHTPFEEERKMLMPVEKAFPLKEVLKEIRAFDFGRQRRVSFEYILFKGFNDSSAHVKELVRLLGGLRCRINLIRFHPIPGSALEGSDEETVQNFKEELNDRGITATVRASKGLDIFAACGLLSTKAMIDNK